jgi:hypothetical protein
MFLHPVAGPYTHWQWREARRIQRAHGLLPSVDQRTRRTSVQQGASLCRADITSQCPSTLMAPGGCKGPCNFSNTCEAPVLALLHPDAYDFSSHNSRTYICPTGTNYQVFCPLMDISAPEPMSTNTFPYRVDTHGLLILHKKQNFWCDSGFYREFYRTSWIRQFCCI